MQALLFRLPFRYEAVNVVVMNSEFIISEF